MDQNHRSFICFISDFNPETQEVRAEMFKCDVMHTVLLSEPGLHASASVARNQACAPQRRLLRTRPARLSVGCSEPGLRASAGAARNQACAPQRGLPRTRPARLSVGCSEPGLRASAWAAQNQACTPAWVAQNQACTPAWVAQNQPCTPQRGLLRTRPARLSMGESWRSLMVQSAGSGTAGSGAAGGHRCATETVSAASCN